ncbi:MAG TPA: PaaI family thioesterase [Stellaceae bacterium]|nr:PaaI family thioesterase [Stellaceae bacterium]
MTDPVERNLSSAEVQAIFDRSPFIGWLGLKVLSLDHERQEITVKMAMRPELERRPGTRQFHGGPIAALIDIAGDFAIGMLAGGGVPTVNLRTDYLRPAIGESLTAVARVRRKGKTTTVVDIDVLDDGNRVVALGRGTYSSVAG